MAYYLSKLNRSPEAGKNYLARAFYYNTYIDTLFVQQLMKELSSAISVLIFYDRDADGGLAAAMMAWLMEHLEHLEHYPTVHFCPLTNGDDTKVYSGLINKALNTYKPTSVFFLDISPMNEDNKRTVPEHGNAQGVNFFFVDEHPKSPSAEFEKHRKARHLFFYNCPVNYATSGRVFGLVMSLLHQLDSASCQEFIHAFHEVASAVNYIDCGCKCSLSSKRPSNSKDFTLLPLLPGYDSQKSYHLPPAPEAAKDMYSTIIKWAVTRMLYSRDDPEPFFDLDSLSETYACVEETVLRAYKMIFDYFDKSWREVVFDITLEQRLQNEGVSMFRDVRILFLGPIVKELVQQLGLLPEDAVTLVEACRMPYQVSICAPRRDEQGEVIRNARGWPIQAPHRKGREVLKLTADDDETKELTLLYYCHDPDVNPGGGIAIRKIGAGDCAALSRAFGGNGGSQFAAGSLHLPYSLHDEVVTLQASAQL